MDRTKEDVNWSAVACAAFEQKLGQIAAQKEKKTMDDVIQRLRASKSQSDSEHYETGHTDGQAWAKDTAEAEDLRRLDVYRSKHSTVSDWYCAFEHENAYPAQDIQRVIAPEQERDQLVDFWCVLSGSEDVVDSMPHEYFRGFVEGALSIWDEVKGQL